MAGRHSSRHSPPLVGIPACFRNIAGIGYHMVAEKYVLAVVEAVGAAPVIIPALGELQRPEDFLSRLDGLLITGSQSNVEPARYGGRPSDPGTLHDPPRDASNLPLIPAAVKAGVPLLAICRGCQELNVAYGGTLHQKVHELPDRLDHRADNTQPVDVQFGPRHSVRFTPGGLLAKLIGSESAIVNSVHAQGVDRVGAGLAVEAVAEDGQVEAIRVEDAPAFALGVQWHPEHRHAENPVSQAIFAAFADAIHRRQSLEHAA
ncbi:MAG TPA: gamma-glutamyl-gamma-aminobutyrate hydrolase family protein [Alphaproteobacteria bacterium]|nr:gamma-glutamyl-gamma-aminobutyrate hydrolase family protein [Alphaproteobacteria bacterium]